MKTSLFTDRMLLTRSSLHGHAVVSFIFAIGLFASSAAIAASWETSSLRTSGGGLVRLGMTRQEVLKELGQSPRTRPAAHNVVTGGKSGKKNSTLTYHGDDGIYTITFSGEQVVRIVVSPKRD